MLLPLHIFENFRQVMPNEIFDDIHEPLRVQKNKVRYATILEPKNISGLMQKLSRVAHMGVSLVL